MALTSFELKRCERALDLFLKTRRPPPHLRDQVDVAYRVVGHSVEIFEIRPDWRDSSQKYEIPIAKTTFVRTRGHWRVFWKRSDLKWHGYEPHPEVNSLARFLEVVHKDEHCCFFG